MLAGILLFAEDDDDGDDGRFAVAEDWHNAIKLSHVLGHLSVCNWKTTVWGGDPATEMRKWQNILAFLCKGSDVWRRASG